MTKEQKKVEKYLRQSVDIARSNDSYMYLSNLSTSDIVAIAQMIQREEHRKDTK